MIEQKHETFRLPFSEISNLSAREALEKIRASKRIRLGDLKLFDLILENDEPTSIWHGVYLFFSEEGKCLYVGKNGSQNFIERIPLHFALHEKAWMNYLLKYLVFSKEGSGDSLNCCWWYGGKGQRLAKRGVALRDIALLLSYGIDGLMNSVFKFWFKGLCKPKIIDR